jgi:hypothetical protein
VKGWKKRRKTKQTDCKIKRIELERQMKRHKITPKKQAKIKPINWKRKQIKSERLRIINPILA